MRKTILGVIVAIGALLTISCATFNMKAERLVHDSIVANEQLHTAGKLTDVEFQSTAKALNTVAVAGREYTKLEIAHQTTAADDVAFVKSVSRAVTELAQTPYGAKLGPVLTKLNELMALGLQYLNAASGR